jgi:cardiolipin synthase (CMP-forming)
MKYIPNLLTALRLVLVPVIWKYIWDREYAIALAFGAIASITDVLDGWLARLLKATSKIGAYLDPVADKLMLSGAYLLFGLDKVIPEWLMWIVLGRDIMILLFAAGAYLFTRIRDFPPSIWGKLSTFIQIITALVILVNHGSIIFDVYTYRLERRMSWLCGAVTVWSAIHYLWLAIARLRRTPTQASLVESP